MSDKEVTTRILEEDRDKLNRLSEKYNMKASAILGHIIDQSLKYNTLDMDWEKALAENQLHDFLMDADMEYRKTFERDKHRAILRAKQTAFQEYIKVMPPDERKPFLEQILGDPATNGDFLDNLSSYQMYTVNGERKLLSPGEEGAPNMPGIHPDRIVTCERGHHIIGDFCKCLLWRTCELRASEYQNYIAVHGTEATKTRYIDRANRRY